MFYILFQVQGWCLVSANSVIKSYNPARDVPARMEVPIPQVPLGGALTATRHD